MRKRTRLGQLLSAVFGRWNRPELTSILIVDDDARVRTLMHGRLEIAGYRVDEAPNGAMARYVSGCSYNVVLTDFVMPEMDGREFISLLRDQFADARIVAYLVPSVTTFTSCSVTDSAVGRSRPCRNPLRLSRCSMRSAPH